MTTELKVRAHLAFQQKLQTCHPKRTVHNPIPCRFSFIDMDTPACVLHGSQYIHCPIYVEAIRK